MPTKTYRGLEKCFKPVVKTNIKYIKLVPEKLLRPVDESYAEQLKVNLSKVGQISPVIIVDMANGMYRVSAKAHEFRGLQMLAEEIWDKDKSQIIEIDTKRFVGTDLEEKIMQLSENIVRKEMTMKEVGEQVDMILKMDKKLKQKDIAEELGWSPSYVCECLGEFNGKPKSRPDSKNSTVEFQELAGDTVGTEPEPQTDPQTEPEPQIDTETPHITQSEPSGDPQQVIESQTAKPTDAPEKPDKDLLKIEGLLNAKVKPIASSSKFQKSIESMIKDAIALENFDNGFTPSQKDRIVNRLNILSKKIENVKRNLNNGS
jgi:hypothetical protein